MARPSIFEYAGGETAFLRLATAHHERCLADPELNHPFSHPGHPEHVQRLAWYWGEVFGGPPRYSEVSEGQTGMQTLHAGMGAQSDFGDRFVDCFMKAADDVGLPDDPDFRQALRSYMEWAVADVHVYNARGSTVPSGLDVPRWSWDGLQAGPSPS
jgi:hemoglobin